MSDLFWLHIKKSAGTSARDILSPFYTEVDRVNLPPSFLQTSSGCWNDILNNYRTPLGAYQFHRSEFAKRYLFPETWDNLFTLAFSRHPVDRALSMFTYLMYGRSPFHSLVKWTRLGVPYEKFLRGEKYKLSLFLDMIEVQEGMRQKSAYQPYGLHFSTHTNPMSNDVLSPAGEVNIKNIFRLENFADGIKYCYECLGAEPPEITAIPHKNKTLSTISPDLSQIRKIEKLFQSDFEIYEKAW